MSHLSTMLLSNALLVLPLGLLVFLITLRLRHPGLVWALWGLVLLKFVTPALIPLPVDVASLGSIPDGQTTGTADRQTTLENWEAPDRAQPIRDAGADTHSDAERPATPAAPTTTPDILPSDADLPLEEAPPLPASDEPTILIAEEDLTSRSGAAETSPADIAPSVISTTPLGTPPAPKPPQTETSASRTSDHASRAPHPVSRFPFNWPRLLWIAWVIGALVMLMLALWRIIRFRRLLTSATPADDELVAIASELADQLGLQRLPALRLTDGRIPPLLYGGLRRAVILLPRQLLATLDAESRRTLLAHELAHIARRDHWTRWLELLVRCLYWWHPLAWYAGRRLRDAEEQCCDARVVALLPGSAAAYARTILTTVDYLAGHAHAVPTLATGLQPLRRSLRPLHRRLTMIVEHQPTARMSWPSRLILVALAVCILPLSLLAQSGTSVERPAVAADTRPSAADDAAGKASAPAAAVDPQETREVQADIEDHGAAADRSDDNVADEQGTPPILQAAPVPLQPAQPPSAPSNPSAPVIPHFSEISPGSGTARPVVRSPRPQVLTAPQELDEITVVARVYKLEMRAVQQVREFLLEVRDGFRVLRLSDPLSPAPGYPGTPYGGGGAYNPGVAPSGYAIPPMSADGTHPGIPLRVLAPAEAHAVLEGFLKLFGPATGEPPAEGEQTIVLVRTEYELPPAAAEKFAALLSDGEQHGLTSPLIIKRQESRVTVTAAKDVQEKIRRLITYLGENWQTAGMSPEDASQPLKRLAGIELAPLSEPELKRLQSKFPGGGVKVVAIDESAPLRARGIRVGDVLVALDGIAVTSADDIRRKLELIRKGEMRYLLVDRSGESIDGVLVPNDRGSTDRPTAQPIPGTGPSIAPQIPKTTSHAASSEKVQELDRKIAELELDRAKEALEFTKRFMQRGYKSDADLKRAELEVLKAERDLERLQEDRKRNPWARMARDYAVQRTLAAEQHTPWQIMQVIAAAGADAQILVDGKPKSAWEYVSNDPQFSGKSWFVADGDGVHVRPSSSPYQFEGHPNQFAAWLVAAGAELDFPIYVDGKEFTLQDLVQHAQQTIDSSKDQSWTLALLAQTVDVDAEWTSESGDTWSIARLLELELDAGLERAADDGFHRLMAITFARNAWVEKHGEPTGVWERAGLLINQMTQQVQQNQSEDGLLTLRSTAAASNGSELRETGQVLTWLATALSRRAVRGGWIGRSVFRLETMLRASVDRPMEVSEYFAAVRAMRAIAEAIESQQPRPDGRG
jgi:beta-lactamase regulating signal transducer with metallopeptidase domain